VKTATQFVAPVLPQFDEPSTLVTVRLGKPNSQPALRDTFFGEENDSVVALVHASHVLMLGRRRQQIVLSTGPFTYADPIPAARVVTVPYSPDFSQYLVGNKMTSCAILAFIRQMYTMERGSKEASLVWRKLPYFFATSVTSTNGIVDQLGRGFVSAAFVASTNSNILADDVTTINVNATTHVAVNDPFTTQNEGFDELARGGHFVNAHSTNIINARLPYAVAQNYIFVPPITLYANAAQEAFRPYDLPAIRFGMYFELGAVSSAASSGIAVHPEVGVLLRAADDYTFASIRPHVCCAISDTDLDSFCLGDFQPYERAGTVTTIHSSYV
jgi:hypothetical protein